MKFLKVTVVALIAVFAFSTAEASVLAKFPHHPRHKHHHPVRRHHRH